MLKQKSYFIPDNYEYPSELSLIIIQGDMLKSV